MQKMDVMMIIALPPLMIVEMLLLLAREGCMVQQLASFFTLAAAAVAAPISPPDIYECGKPRKVSDDVKTDCCPPVVSDIKDFKFPPSTAPMRVRRAAQEVKHDEEYMEKFTRAIQLMKDLDKTDPRNFMQQASVHCAYCEASYHQVGFPDKDLAVHGSWLFLPFHRWYLYFFERILGKLIDDESFAIPFWNWDAPRGMTMPEIYTDPASPLYDKLRDPRHLPPKVVDLEYRNGVDSTDPDQKIIEDNLVVMYRQMVINGKTPRGFLGHPYRAGKDPEGSGSLERVPHGTVHNWMGDLNQTHYEDMGNFYSAGRDPIFYAHHANLDRMWILWKQMGGNHKDLDDTDWLDSAFLFYDENAKLVKVKVRDCLDTTKLKYNYQQVDVPWLNSKPASSTHRLLARMMTGTVAKADADHDDDYNKKKLILMKAADAGNAASVFPRKIDSVVKAVVKRPRKKKKYYLKDDDGQEATEVDELLVIDQIEVRRDVPVKLDVFVNVEDHEKHGPGTSEFAGSFVNVAHRHNIYRNHSNNDNDDDDDDITAIMKTKLSLGITELLEEIGADEDDEVVVTLVPRDHGKGTGPGVVTVGGVHIVNDVIC